MRYVIAYYNEALQTEILNLPNGMLSRYLALTDRMETYGANLGLPHTKAFGSGLFNYGLKAQRALPAYFIARWWGSAL